MPESGVKEVTKTMAAVARLIDVYKTYQSGTVEVPALKGITLVFNGAICVGSSGSEFGSGNHGGFLRGRVYS